jgi:hypothetical protein
MSKRQIEATKLANLVARDAAIKARFQDLYHAQRLRYDDVITMLASEYFVAEVTIGNALRRAGAYQRNVSARDTTLDVVDDSEI